MNKAHIGFGAYDGYRSLNEGPTILVPRQMHGMHKHTPNQMDGWFSDRRSDVWNHFKPMLPWFIVTNLVTAIVIWKIASLACSGRLLFSDAKHSISSGFKSAKSSMGAGWGKAKSAIGKN